MVTWLAIRSKLTAIGAVFLTVLAFFVRLQSVKRQRNKARINAAVLDAVVNAERTKKIIKEEERKKGVSRRDTIREKVKEREEGKDFEGIDNLIDPNDY